MKEVYDRGLRRALRLRLGLWTLLLVLALTLACAALCVLYRLRTREAVLLLSLASALILTVWAMLSAGIFVCCFLSDYEYRQFLARTDARTPDSVTGRLIRTDETPYTYRRVRYRVLEFDCGDRRLTEPVLRGLYLEMHLPIMLKENRLYRLNIVDNCILAYEELPDESTN